MRVTRIGTAAIAAALAAGALAPGTASGGIGPGLGTPTFTLETLTSGATSDPRVVMQTDTTALTSFVDYATRPAGIFHVCQVPLDATSCARTTAVTPTDDAGDMSLVFSGPQLLLANGTANFTEIFTSGDGGATFGPAVRVSRYANAENVLPLPDGRLLLVGRGNDSRANDLHAVVVPPDGSGVDTAGFSLPNTDYPGAQRGVADNGGRYVVLGGGFVSVGSTRTQIAYAVYDGSGDPNAISSWTQSTLPLQFNDAPNIAGGPSGVVLVAVDADGAVVASKLEGTTFPAPTRIGDPAGKAYLPNVTQDATGRITATWQVNGVGLRESHSRDGVRWSAPRTLTSDREFDTDIATGPAGNGLAVTRAGGRYQATRIYAAVSLSLKASPAKVEKGKATTLTAKLTGETGAPLAGRPIALRAGGKTLATKTTNAAGEVTLTTKPSKTTRYRARFAGTDVLASYTSAAAKVTVTRR